MVSLIPYKDLYLNLKTHYLTLKYSKCGGANKSGNWIDFPFEYMHPKYSKMEVKWLIDDKDSGERLPMKDLRKIYKMIDKIYYYKQGWGIGDTLPYNTDEEPCILLARLNCGVYLYVYSTTDYTGYDCINNYFEVIYSHDLERLHRYGLTEKVRSLLNITL